MDDEKAFAIMFSVVRLALQELTDAELVGLHLAAHLGLDPRGKPGYDKIAYLFTQENGTKMHEETLRAYNAMVIERLGK